VFARVYTILFGRSAIYIRRRRPQGIYVSAVVVFFTYYTYTYGRAHAPVYKVLFSSGTRTRVAAVGEGLGRNKREGVNTRRGGRANVNLKKPSAVGRCQRVSRTFDLRFERNNER